MLLVKNNPLLSERNIGEMQGGIQLNFKTLCLL